MIEAIATYNIIISILSILVVILGYTTINLLRKNEKAEDIILSQNKFIGKVDEHISFSNDRLKQIDQKGTFKSDDEVGWFFNEIKTIQNDLSQFKKENN
jgi:hypothetical protein